MKLKFTRKTWYFLLLASAAASMLNGFAVLSGTSFGLIEQIAFAAAEGVDPSRVRDSIRRGLKQLAKYF